jgi:threonylcarbamoyladenosine tRNA methylthiotransferase MtaB
MALAELVPAPHELSKLPVPRVQHTRVIERDEFVMPGTGDFDTARATLKIQDGCNFMCSFCLIPYARGRERSRVADDVLREALQLVARGHRELVLSGVNIGQYASQGINLVGLIRRLEKIDGLDRIRISSIEPTTITGELLAHMVRSEKLCRYLHIPCQSGDDALLRAMNRRYTVNDYALLIESIARQMPDIGLGTDLLVGFPGEQQEQYERTCRLAADLPFSYFHVFSFSPRPGTPAAGMPDQIPPSVMQARVRRLAALSRTKRLEFYRRFLDSRVRVLFEFSEGNGHWIGHTENFMKVAVRSRQPLRKQFGMVEVTAITDGLGIGRLVSEDVSVSRPTLVVMS